MLLVLDATDWNLACSVLKHLAHQQYHKKDLDLEVNICMHLCNHISYVRHLLKLVHGFITVYVISYSPLLSKSETHII